MTRQKFTWDSERREYVTADGQPMREVVKRPPGRVPLTTGQHILHLLLTVLTGGLWAPVWIFRAMHGNPAEPRPR